MVAETSPGEGAPATAAATPTATRAAFGFARLTRFERAAAGFILLGVVLRAAYVGSGEVGWDQAWYLHMAQSLLERGEFTLPWMGEPTVYTQHFPPFFPAYLAAFFALLGTSLLVAHVATLVAGVALLAVTFLCTRDLYGRSRAFAVTAIMATFPLFVQYDARLQTESLVTLFFVATMWAILKSLDRPPFIVLAGVFAALGYLTKASMGTFFVLAGLAGFAWRFYYMRWEVLRNRHYLAAIAIFGATFVLWAARNVLRFGWPNWETQRHASDSFRAMLATPTWPLQMVQVVLWLAVVTAIFALPYLAELRKAARRPTLMEERTSGLWMGVFTPLLVAVFFVTAFTIAEERPIVDYSSLRYVVTSLPILLWIGLRHVDFDAPARPEPTEGLAHRRRYRALVATGVVALALAAALNPVKYAISLERAVLAMALFVLALVPLALALAWRGEVVTRKGARGEVHAKYALAGGAGRDLGLLVGSGVAGLAAAFFVGVHFFPLAALAGVGAVVRDARARVVAFSVVLAGAALAHAAAYVPVEAAAAGVREHVPAGEAVIVEDEFGQYYAPFLTGYDLVGHTRATGAEAYYLWWEEEPGATLGDGWTLVERYPATADLGPGTALELWLEDLLLGGRPVPPEQSGLALYERATGTGAGGE